MMAGTELKVFALLLVLLGTLRQCQGREFLCHIPSDWTGISLELRVYHADVVVLGMVKRHYPLPGELAQYFPESYGAEVEILCTFKGGPLPRTVNITNIATTDCSFTRTQEWDFLAFLLQYNQEGQLEPYEPNMHAAALTLRDSVTRTILSVCGTGVSPPTGVELSDSQCPERTTQSPCVSGAKGIGDVHKIFLSTIAILVLKLCYVF